MYLTKKCKGLELGMQSTIKCNLLCVVQWESDTVISSPHTHKALIALFTKARRECLDFVFFPIILRKCLLVGL